MTLVGQLADAMVARLVPRLVPRHRAAAGSCALAAQKTAQKGKSMRFRTVRVAMAAVLAFAGLGVAAAPAQAHTSTFCQHQGQHSPPWSLGYLRHTTTPYGVHYHYYDHYNTSTGARHTRAHIC
jgi:hypothetical protein